MLTYEFEANPNDKPKITISFSDSSSTAKDDKSGSAPWVIIVVVSVLSTILCAGFAFWFCWHKKKEQKKVNHYHTDERFFGTYTFQ